MLTKIQYLYGVYVDTTMWATMGYKEVLELKASLADLRIKELNKAHYMVKDSTNINQCVRAIKFNENLLKELR